MLAVLLACSTTPPPTPAPEPAPEPARAVVSVSDGTIIYNGQLLDAALAERDERRIPALYDVLSADERELSVVVGPEISWRPVRRVLLTADARGVTDFWLRHQDGPERGPLSLPHPIAAQPGPPQPVGQLTLHQRGELAWMTATLRFRGDRPADCAETYADEALRAACQQGSAPAVRDLGCLAEPMPPAQAAQDWPAALGPKLSALGADAAWSWLLLVDTSVDIGVLDGVLGALGQTDPARVSLGGASETRGQPAPCTPAEVTDAAGVATAAARWLGSPTP